MSIPIFKLNFDKRFVEKFKQGCEDILTSQRPMSENKYVCEFEEKFAKLVGARYSVAVTNGTTAIELALKAVDVEGKVVFAPANTFFATTLAITNAGGTIGLVDVESENFSLDPQKLREAIKATLAKKEKIGAVVIVHIGGIISKYIKEILTICDDYNIPLIEDAAHAHCSEYEGFRAGTIGKIGCFSFFPTKVMTSAEGGMITTNDEQIYQLLRSIKNFGRDENDENIILNSSGNNYKVTEFTGLLGSMDCDRVIKRIKKRNQLTDIYVERLKNSGYKPILQKKGLCAQYKMILKTNIDREWLRAYCKKHNITLTGEVYKVPIHVQPLYKKMFAKQSFPVTDDVSKHHICPPLYPELTAKEIHYICDILLQAEKEYEK